MSTDLELGVAASLAIAALVLVVGRALIERVEFLRRYSIPEPVVGGLVAAVAAALLHAAGASIAFDTSLQPSLMLAFFATVGLGADVRMLARGGRMLLFFVGCVVGMLVLENVIGVAAARAMGIDPLVGLIAGSVTMAGGHGTGAAWGARFAQEYGLTQAPALALAAATFGLVMGGVIGGPVAMRLIRRLEAQGATLGVADTSNYAHDAAEAEGPFTPMRLIVVVGLVAASIAGGMTLAGWAANPTFTLPAFVWALLVAAVLRNVLAFANVHEVDNRALAFTGSVSLSLFLAMALMSLRLWELAALALPLIVILALQVAGVAAYTSLVTFRVMGSNYEAAVLVAGQCGFGLGATPTAIANIQALSARYGAAPLAFVIVPVVGAFLIDLANAIVISASEIVVLALR